MQRVALPHRELAESVCSLRVRFYEEVGIVIPPSRSWAGPRLLSTATMIELVTDRGPGAGR